MHRRCTVNSCDGHTSAACILAAPPCCSQTHTQQHIRTHTLMWMHRRCTVNSCDGHTSAACILAAPPCCSQTHTQQHIRTHTLAHPTAWNFVASTTHTVGTYQPANASHARSGGQTRPNKTPVFFFPRASLMSA